MADQYTAIITCFLRGQQLKIDNMDWLSSTIDWLSATNAIIPWLALLLSIIGIYTSKKSLRISEAQEERQKPLLSLFLQDGYVRYHPESSSRYFAFLLTVGNRSDVDNSISEIHLRLSYTTSAGVELVVKIPSSVDAEKVFEEYSRPSLSTTDRKDAHQTISGWIYFQVKDALLENCQIERHSIAIIDCHGIEGSVEPIMVREFSS